MTQYALPDTDITILAWTEGAGDADGDAFDELDEGFGAGRGSGGGPDDGTTYWECLSPGDPNEIRTELSAVTDPEGNTDHNYRTRNCKDASGGRQVDISIALFDGVVVGVSSKSFGNIDEVWTTRDDPLTAVEADSITAAGYAGALRIRTVCAEVGGGGPRDVYESAQEFECPDAAPPVGADEMMAAIGQQTGGGGGSGDIMAHSRKPPEPIAY